MKGLHAVCRDCVVTKRTSFKPADSPSMVYQMQLEAWGFVHTFTTSDAAEASRWPEVNAEVHLSAKLEPIPKTGGFKFSLLNFQDVRHDMPKKSASSAA